MRRDQTLKVCANHLISADMELKPNVSSDRSWVYTALGDACEDSGPVELLAIRFGSSENANAFKAKFIEAQSINKNGGSLDVDSLDVDSLKVGSDDDAAADAAEFADSKKDEVAESKDEVKEESTESKDEVKKESTESKDEVKEESAEVKEEANTEATKESN